MKLTPQPLDAAAFAPYGQVLVADPAKALSINQGTCTRFDQLGQIQVDEKSAAQISIFAAKPIELPLPLESLERHPLGSQAFMPMGEVSYCVIVATGDEKPDIDTLRAFVAENDQGVNIGRNVWHHSLVTLGKPASFWVADVGGIPGNLEECPLSEGIVLARDRLLRH